MSLSDQELQKYIGKNVRNVQKELEDQGYKVHLVSTGRFATGYVPARVEMIGEGAPPREKRVIISFNGDDPQEAIQYITED